MKTSKCENRCYRQKYSSVILSSVMLLLGPLILPASTHDAQTEMKFRDQLEQVILTEDWEKIIKMLPKDKEPNMPVEYRLIKAHACLATNYNNDSLCLFLRTSSEEELCQWEEWSGNFAEKYPNYPISYYLRGDAYARLRKWNRSIMDFTVALASDPNHFLVLHSRGVVWALNEKWDEARRDFTACRKMAPTFAEAHVSWGTYIVQRKTDCRIALAAFDRALKYSNNYVLALNGKGSMETITGDLKSAADHLQQASDLSVGCLSDVAWVVNLNALVLGDRINDETEKKIAKATGIKPGMTLSEKMTRFNSLSRPEQQQIVDSVANARHFNGMRVGDILTPDAMNIRSGISGKIGTMGTIPYANIKGEAGLYISKDISRTTKHNIGQQSAFLDRAARQYGITPSSNYNSIGSNIRSFFNNQFGSARDFSHSGGVSSEEIEDTIDIGDWKAVTVYGIRYSVSDEPRQEEDKS